MLSLPFIALVMEQRQRKPFRTSGNAKPSFSLNAPINQYAAGLIRMEHFCLLFD